MQSHSFNGLNYFSHLTNITEKPKLLFWMSGSTPVNFPNTELKAALAVEFERMQEYAEDYKFNLVIPIIERGSYQTDAQILNKEYIFNTQDSRIDLIVQELLTYFKQETFKNANLQIFMGGVSAGATFANRFSLLHPSLITGQLLLVSGTYIYMQNSIEDVQLDYPHGVNNINQVSGQQSNTEQFSKQRIYIYAGAKDNKPVKDLFRFETKDDPQKQKLLSVLGSNPVERALKYVKHLENLGIESNLLIDPNEGHAYKRKHLQAAFEFMCKES